MRYYLLPGEGRDAHRLHPGRRAGRALPVTAPVSGTVTAVKEYKLYGKYDDVQIDIRPEEMSGITVSILFIDDPVVSIGEVVTAGKTQLGKVRECPEELGSSCPYLHARFRFARVHAGHGGAHQLNALLLLKVRRLDRRADRRGPAP